MLQESEPGLSDAGDRNVLSIVNSNCSVFLSEPSAKLVLFPLPVHSESRMVLSAFCCLSQEVSNISSACPHLETFSQVSDTCWTSEWHYRIQALGPVVLLSLKGF